MRLKICALIISFSCLISVNLIAQPEHYVKIQIGNIRSYNQEVIRRDKIHIITAIDKGYFSDDTVMKCTYDKEGLLTDSIGYALGSLAEHYTNQMNMNLPIDPEYCEDGRPLEYRFRFRYNAKGLRIYMAEHHAAVDAATVPPVYSDRLITCYYDTTDRITKADYTNARGLKMQQDLLEYDAAGNLTEWKQYHAGSDESFTCNYTYDRNNNLIEYTKTDAAGDFDLRELFTYNYLGKLATWEDVSKTGLILYRQDYTYDQAGNMIVCLGYIEGEDFNTKLEQTFDAYGNVIKSTVSRGHITRSGDFRFRESKRRRTYVSNDDKSLIEFQKSLRPTGGGTIDRFEYDQNGLIVKAHDWRGMELIFVYSYFE